MRRSSISFVILLLAALGVTVANPRLTMRRPKVAVDFGKLPLSFEANRGQFDDRVKFLSRGDGYSVFLTGSEAVLSLKARSGNSAVLRMTLPGANPAAIIEGRDELPGKSNYFLGDDPAKWRTNVATYSKVAYRDVQPGIDLVYYGNQRQLEYDFVVAPGADPGAIRLRIEGADGLRVDSAGELVVQSGGNEVRWHKPVIYQQASGRRRSVEGGYRIDEGEVRFQVAAYDSSQTLLIDPTLVYSTFLGGTVSDFGKGIALDSAGNAYVTGVAYSSDFPLANPFQPSSGGGGSGDAFITKLNPTGTALLYSTYLGGSGTDQANAIAVDSSGNAYIAGLTSSGNFPTANAYRASKPGFNSGFVSKLNASGSALVYSTYLGGSGASGDQANAIAVDSAGNAYVTGVTYSTDFPALAAFQSQAGKNNGRGGSNAFVSKFGPTGTLVYSTYLGGSSADLGYGIAVDAAGSAYVTGQATSIDFPVSNALQSTTSGRSAFVTKFSPSGSTLVYSTYFGGVLLTNGTVGSVTANAIAVDSAGSAYITGSTVAGLPTTSGSYQPTYPSALLSTNAFVAKFSVSGSTLVYSTYLGGSRQDVGYGIAVDSGGNAYVTGTTNASDFPTTSGSFLTASDAGGAGFITVLNPGGSNLVYSTLLGSYLGSDITNCRAIALDSTGNAYVTGDTAFSSSSYPFPTTPGAFQTKTASQVAFVSKIGPTNPIATLTTLTPSSAQPGGSAFTMVIAGRNFGAGASVRWNGSPRGTTFVTVNQLTANITAADVATAGTANVTVVNPAPGGGESAPLTFTIIGPSQPLPVLTSMTPTSAAAGGVAFTLSLFGSSFTSSSVVQWNGSNRTTTAFGSTQLTAAITAADIATAGTATVTVVNPAPGGGTSAALTFTITAPNNPTPTLTSLSPTSATAGGAAFTLTLTGGNFVSSSTVRWNGSSRTTTFVSASQLTAAITAADIATAGAATVTVFTPTPGGGTSNAINFSIGSANNPVPALAAISPTSATAGGPAFTLTVTATAFSFVSSSVVQWNGSARTTTYVDISHLTANITAADIAAAGSVQVTVFTPAPGGGTSLPLTFTITGGNNPVPGISFLSPSTASAGGGIFTLTVNGSGFVSGSIVRWNGTTRSTTYVNATQLTAVIAASDIANAGTGLVSVFNPTPGGGTSSVVGFVIAPPSGGNPVGTITSLSPTTVLAGAAQFTITVNGSNFQTASVVRWGGLNRTTAYVSATQLQATIYAADVAFSGTVQVSVFTPPPGGGVSNLVSFTITAPTANLTPTITQLLPGGMFVGTTPFTGNLTIGGSNFVSGSIVQWNGQSRVTTFVASSTLSATLLASDLATAGTAQVTVLNPGGIVSASFTFTVLPTLTTYPAPTIGSLLPAGFEAGQFFRVLTVTGTGFTPASQVFWNGSQVFTTYISGTVLSANLAASNIATTGTFQVTVSNPSPGGGVSPAVSTAVIGAPTFPANGVISGVTFDPNQLPSAAGIGSMFGVNLAPSTVFASTIPLPTTLGGVSININGILAPLFFVSQGQINFQFPWELVGLTQLTATINNNGVVSPAQTINLQVYAPGVFTLNQQGTGQAAVQIANTSTFVAPVGSIPGQVSRPVQRGEYISIFCGGLGPVSNPPADGDLAGASPLSNTIAAPTVTIGGVPATVSFSGLAPGFAGLYQVNVQIPSNAPSGNSVSLAMSIGGSNSNQTTIAVQ
jgi:uncharacterized protein (TIGR03437 family)